MRHVDDAFVVKIVVHLQQRYQHRILTVLLFSVLIELCQEVLVLVFGRCCIGFVLHFKHDRHDLGALIILITEDEITLGTLGGIVVFLKIGISEKRSDPVELIEAMLLKVFTDHFGRLLGLEILIVGDQFVLIGKFLAVALFHRLGIGFEFQNLLTLLFQGLGQIELVLGLFVFNFRI